MLGGSNLRSLPLANLIWTPAHAAPLQPPTEITRRMAAQDTGPRTPPHPAALALGIEAILFLGPHELAWGKLACCGGCQRNAPGWNSCGRAEEAPRQHGGVLSSVHMAAARRTERRTSRGLHRLEPGDGAGPPVRYPRRRTRGSGGHDVQLEFHLGSPRFAFEDWSVTLSARMNVRRSARAFASRASIVSRPARRRSFGREGGEDRVRVGQGFWPDRAPQARNRVIAVSVALK